MNHRILRLMPSAVACYLLFPAAVEAAEPVKRPNILFCFADDWGRYASAYASVETRPSANQVVKP